MWGEAFILFARATYDERMRADVLAKKAANEAGLQKLSEVDRMRSAQMNSVR